MVLIINIFFFYFYFYHKPFFLRIYLVINLLIIVHIKSIFDALFFPSLNGQYDMLSIMYILFLYVILRIFPFFRRLYKFSIYAHVILIHLKWSSNSFTLFSFLFCFSLQISLFYYLFIRCSSSS